MKRIFAALLATSMILLALVPFAITTVSADTFNASDANPTITTAADLKAFLESGDSFSGKTITLQFENEDGSKAWAFYSLGA